MPKETPQERRLKLPIVKRGIQPELLKALAGIIVIEILVWAYVISAGLRDIRRQLAATDLTIDGIDFRLTMLEDEVRRPQAE